MSAARTLDVPRSASPTLDGKADGAEWARANTVDLGSGVTLRMMHDGAKVYLAVSGLTTGTGFGCVMVDETDRVSIFHACALDDPASLTTAEKVPEAHDPVQFSDRA